MPQGQKHGGGSAEAARAFARPRTAGHTSSRRGWRIALALLLLAPALLIGARTVAGRIADPYAVSVPVTLRPYDPALWSMVNAEDFAAARAIDASLPDPFAVETLAQASGSPADIAALRQQAYTGPPARPYAFRGRSAVDTTRAHYCLTAALYYEAASESDDGMRGVAQVILNRARHPSFPGSVCGVVFQGSQRAIVCQFTFSCDGSMARAPSRAGWTRAARIAAEALGGRVFAPVGLATHYHTQAVWPAWGRSLAMTNVIGAHIFHRWRGRYGEPSAFSRPYSGREPAPGPYLSVAEQLAVRAGRASTPATTPLLPVPGTAIGGPAVASAPLSGASHPGFAPLPAPAAGARSAPAYADPRLAQSGSVREEYRSSGSAIAR